MPPSGRATFLHHPLIWGRNNRTVLVVGCDVIRWEALSLDAVFTQSRLSHRPKSKVLQKHAYFSKYSLQLVEHAKGRKKRYLCPRVTGVRFISRLVSIPHMDTDLYVRMYTPTHRIEAWLNAASEKVK